MLNALLERVFQRLNTQNVEEVIARTNPKWSRGKKQKNKQDLLPDFLDLADFIEEGEIEDFVEMAVMTNQKGWPAYTYRVRSTEFFQTDQSEKFDSVPFQNHYIIILEDSCETEDEYRFNLRIKEYAEKWRHGGVLNTDSLTAVYRIPVIINKIKEKLTIHAGNETIHDVVSTYLKNNLNWPISQYTIRENINQTFQLGNASYNTAIFLDFIYNRLSKHGIEVKFEEIKFDTEGRLQNSEGIKKITLNGSNILSSQSACEYITMGSSIIVFKLKMTYNNRNFSGAFSVKERDMDTLKIVVIDQFESEFKEEVMEIIQDCYIQMCTSGIYDMNETKRTLDTIYEKFARGIS
ncbi:hypothetical protein MUO14_03600 [Halobacillus shinanisalinarum]|uniref:Uncharacterized protein n=1 Tax=Halobacillus shinanisalinarum TaxID=2932258 RepID=A0ABY4H377_9BACI|nr:hypothetical protein [Halobacillus shinanisalinarum]UOQ94067.1 hypothetical protein MUO14_03600 [Halobacillus shinanisalinarum]